MIELEVQYGDVFDKVAGGKAVLSKRDVSEYVEQVDQKVLQLFGITNWEDLFQKADIDSDGMVNRHEFVVFFVDANLEGERCYDALFDAIDVDLDGKLTMDEIREFEWHEYKDL